MHKVKEASDVPHVALLIETSKAFGRDIIKGVGRFSRIHGPWSIFIDEFGPGSKLPGWLKDWQGDGIIVRARNQKMAESVAAIGVPVIETLQAWPSLGIGGVFTDDEAIGRVAAEHLMARGLKYYGFVGVDGAHWSRTRQDGFARTLVEAGHEVAIYSATSRRRHRENWEGGQEDLANWLAELPKPLGLMAAHDMRALCVFDACRRRALSTPEEIAIVGVDNDDVICTMADTPLTSISHNSEQIGYEAAALLSKVMRGTAAARQTSLIAPRGLSARRSTDVIAAADPIIAKSLKFIRDRKGNTSVQQVANQFGLSRRSLERKFAEGIGTTPHEQITSEKLQHAKLLLQETSYSLEEIAEQMQLSSASYFSSFFKELTGKNPGAFRKEMRELRVTEEFYPSGKERLSRPIEPSA
ncbi:XylR family transcriptional regulator [Blastopirellula marina]|uniref:XylR family transcriptional regulator n=1 Tax=Blastopirellula marina TaxID=124 RepID=A0A2S8G2G0_9BACT|nr:XylR family transcriptional regulator [Blastopirellula marina]PQO38490.1 XylR family transcriptional regulator [Blastopirellula marina]PTL45147.1 xylose operon transcription regulator XylR [Blastopirellula marina]